MIVYKFEDVIKEQKQSLDYKILRAIEAIRQAFEASRSAVGLAFSGGKDSTVLWHLVRTYFPDKEYHVIFGNTTVEFPESLKFARKLGAEWGSDKVHFHEVLPELLEEDGLKYEAQKEVLKWLISEGKVSEVLKDDGKLKTTETLERAATPEMWEDFRKRNLVWKKGTMKSFNWCCDQYGYPILGKAASKLTARRINIDCFLRFSKSGSAKEKTLEYYELLKRVKTSNHCCSILKKEPSEKKQAELNIDVIMKGLMAEESHSRLLSFSTRGYLYKSHRPHAEEFYHCSPLGIWTDADIWDYIHRYNVPYSLLYDIEYKNGCGETCHIKRNGCVGCCTDIAYKDNHMSVLRKTHPKLWEHQMTHGLGDQLVALQKFMSNGKLNYLNTGRDGADIADERPCAFDDIGAHILHNIFTDSEYDSEEEQMTIAAFLDGVNEWDLI